MPRKRYTLTTTITVYGRNPVLTEEVRSKIEANVEYAIEQGVPEATLTCGNITFMEKEELR